LLLGRHYLWRPASVKFQNDILETPPRPLVPLAACKNALAKTQWPERYHALACSQIRPNARAVMSYQRMWVGLTPEIPEYIADLASGLRYDRKISIAVTAQIVIHVFSKPRSKSCPSKGYLQPDCWTTTSATISKNDGRT
jgi:hypothetical protein